MIISTTAGFFIWNVVLNYCKYILILQKWLKLNFPNLSKFFNLIMLLNTLNMISKLFCILMALFINWLVQVPLSKMVEPNENFVIFLTLFVLSFSLPKFLLIFGAKLLFMLFMLLIAFPVLSSKLKLHMSAFLGHLQIITTFLPSILLVSFLFSSMSIINLSLSLNFVVFSAMTKLKRGIGIWSCLSLSLYLSQCFLLGILLLCRAFSLLCLPIYLLCLRYFSR